MSISNANCLIANGARVDETGYSEGTPLQLAKQLFSDKQYEDFVTQIRHHQPNLSVSKFFCFCDFFFLTSFMTNRIMFLNLNHIIMILYQMM